MVATSWFGCSGPSRIHKECWSQIEWGKPQLLGGRDSRVKLKRLSGLLGLSLFRVRLGCGSIRYREIIKVMPLKTALCDCGGSMFKISV